MLGGWGYWMDGDWVRGLIFTVVTIVALVAISWVLGAVVIHMFFG
jgi:hypothetical protein